MDNPPAGFDEIDLLLTLGIRIGFFGYWLFDNLVILAKLKLFSKPAKSFLKPAMVSWWTALMLNLILNIKKLRTLKKELGKLRKKIGDDEEMEKAFSKELASKIKFYIVEIYSIFISLVL